MDYWSVEPKALALEVVRGRYPDEPTSLGGNAHESAPAQRKQTYSTYFGVSSAVKLRLFFEGFFPPSFQKSCDEPSIIIAESWVSPSEHPGVSL